MHEAVRVLAIICYVILIAAAGGYARLLTKQSRSHPAMFLAIWLSFAVVFSFAFHRWGVPGIERHFARTWAKQQLERKPGLARISARHTDVRDALETVALTGLRGGSREQVFEASLAYAATVKKYSDAYLSIASDDALVEYMRQLVAFLEAATDYNASVCGVLLNGDWSALPAAIDPRVDIDKFQAVRDAAFLSAFVAPHAPLSSARADEIEALMTQFLEQKYGRTKTQMFLSFINSSTLPDDPELCSMSAEMMRHSLQLSSPDREDTIRAIVAVDGVR